MPLKSPSMCGWVINTPRCICTFNTTEQQQKEVFIQAETWMKVNMVGERKQANRLCCISFFYKILGNIMYCIRQKEDQFWPEDWGLYSRGLEYLWEWRTCSLLLLCDGVARVYTRQNFWNCALWIYAVHFIMVRHKSVKISY